MSSGITSSRAVLVAVVLSGIGGWAESSRGAVGWVAAAAEAGWASRSYHSAVVQSGKMWVLGGGITPRNDVWSSVDGVSWTAASLAAAWPARNAYVCISYGPEMWVMGGWDGAMARGDVWHSADGASWTEATGAAAWGARSNMAGSVHNGEMWVLGGDASGLRHDVWRSSNGTDWMSAGDAPWSARRDLAAVSFGGSLWVTGGDDGSPLRDIWQSADGISWIQITATAPWAARSLHGLVECAGRLWVVGGRDGGSTRLNDVWYSSDGITWIQASPAAPWSARFGHATLSYGQQLWVLGGDGNALTGGANDVWYGLTDCVAASITVHPISQSVCTGWTAALSIAAGGTPGPVYQWRKGGNPISDGGAISGSNTAALAIHPVALSDAGSYDCVVSNACGSAASNAAVLTVNAGPSAADLQVVISEVYGGGGNAAAPFQNDFLELFNKGTTTVDLTGWSVQYTSATGTAWAQNVTTLSGSIAPGHYYLVRESSGGTNGAPLPTPNASGSISLNATAGKVALVRNSTGLGSSTCPASCDIVDLVGYGTTANCFEGGGRAPAPSNSASISRKVCAYVDTDDNARDFGAGSVTPRNGSFAQGDAPVIVTHPASTMACLGASASFSVTASSSDPLSYRWRKAGGDIPGATNPIYSISTVTNGDAGSYDCVVTNACGSATSAAATLTISTGPTQEQSQIVISQIYGGGGNAGAPYSNEFIELFNRGTSAVDVTGWSVQHASATGSGWRQNVTTLSGSIAPGHYYLIQEGTSGSEGQPLPAPDAIGTINMSATAAKVALVRNSSGLATVVCPSDCNIVDVVGYGSTANCYEGSGPAPGTTASTSVMRKACGYVDSSDSAADFVAGDVVPRNRTAPTGTSPAILDSPVSTMVCWGGAASFSITAAGTETLRYQWRKNGVAIGGATASSYAIDPVIGLHAGNYDVVVSNVCGAVISDSATLVVDVPPVVTAPADLTVHADAGGCSATLANFSSATAIDDFDLNPVITFSRSDGKSSLLDSYETVDSPVTITWTAADQCGNTASMAQHVIVDGLTQLTVDVELAPVLDDISPLSGDVLSRCIRFEFWSCPDGAVPSAVADHVIAFPVDEGEPHLALRVPVLVPCGAYNCMTVRDRLHTLRSTSPNLAISGRSYSATVAGSPAAGGHWLMTGNLNDDRFIDILDFGAFAVRFQASYGVGDTTCSTPFFHADVSGDGLVFTSDFSFIQVNFGRRSEANCCGRAGLDDPDAAARTRLNIAGTIGQTQSDKEALTASMLGRGRTDEPVTSVAVAELWREGLGELAGADLNGDGVLDEGDMRMFAAEYSVLPARK